MNLLTRVSLAVIAASVLVLVALPIHKVFEAHQRIDAPTTRFEVARVPMSDLIHVPASVRNSICVPLSIWSAKPIEGTTFSALVTDLTRAFMITPSGSNFLSYEIMFSMQGRKGEFHRMPVDSDAFKKVLRRFAAGDDVYFFVGFNSLRHAYGEESVTLRERYLEDGAHLVRLVGFDVDKQEIELFDPNEYRRTMKLPVSKFLSNVAWSNSMPIRGETMAVISTKQ